MWFCYLTFSVGKCKICDQHLRGLLHALLTRAGWGPTTETNLHLWSLMQQQVLDGLWPHDVQVGAECAPFQNGVVPVSTLLCGGAD